MIKYSLRLCQTHIVLNSQNLFLQKNVRKVGQGNKQQFVNEQSRSSNQRYLNQHALKRIVVQ